MSTNFNPTHRTNRAIGSIKAGSPIRVARYDSRDYFSDLMMQLGEVDYHLDYRYCGNDVQFWDPIDKEATRKHALPGDYILTDGEHFEVSGTDFGWDPLPTQKVGGTEEVTITFHGTYYGLHGMKSGTTLRMTDKDILSLANRIKAFVPEPSPIEDARFIGARFVLVDEYRTLAKIDGAWYDNNGEAYTQEQVLDEYDEIEVIV